MLKLNNIQCKRYSVKGQFNGIRNIRNVDIYARQGLRKMDKREFDAVIKQPPKIRYDYFIKKVVDYEEVWG
ncbi:hypothetical protein AAV98_15050, partial [Bacillus sp. CHD6a]